MTPQHQDIDRTTDQLSELRDALEKIFKATTTPRPSGAASLPSAVQDSENTVHEILTNCRIEINKLVDMLRAGTDRFSSPGLGVVLSGLARIAIALRGVMEVEPK